MLMGVFYFMEFLKIFFRNDFVLFFCEFFKNFVVWKVFIVISKVM